ncbi:hypothetical protein N7454_007816 [Penicillium verhagenii]|nr:hypothetical protein N7454_007816 [Penicillium verhagenii]
MDSLPAHSRELFERVRQPNNGPATLGDIYWLRTSYGQDSESAWNTIYDTEMSRLLGEDSICNDESLYNFGPNWEGIFLIKSELLETELTAEEYEEATQSGLREGIELEANSPQRAGNSGGLVDDIDLDLQISFSYHQAISLNRIHIVDTTTLASEGPDAGKVLIVFFDEFGRTVRYAREEPFDDIEMMDVDDEDPNFSQPSALTCPANNCATPGSSNPDNLPACSWILPELRFSLDNCDVSSDRQATRNGAMQAVPGICTNVLNFFRGRGLAVGTGVKLTWDSNTQRQYNRRGEACPKTFGLGFCNPDNTALATKMGLPVKKQFVGCDEFPIASSEEGGSFYATLPQNPTSVEKHCVPVWQQHLQGNCNKLLSNIYGNVNVSGVANWQSWAPSNPQWFDKSQGWQSMADYTEYPTRPQHG